MVMALMTGKSVLLIACREMPPRPGIPKKLSTKMEPRSHDGIWLIRLVAMEMNAFLSTCLKSTRCSARPLALAVRT